MLVLGGTAEARTLATRLAADGLDVVSSLQGQVSRPALPAGEVRIGGFGGADGLATYLRDERIERVLDATHPFAATITRHAVQACARTATPLLAIVRPPWAPAPGDRWIPVADVAAAALAVRDAPVGGTVLLTTGRRDLAAFAGDDAHAFVVRAVDPPGGPMPARTSVVRARGPFDVEGETALLRRHDVSLLVTRNSGGPLTAAKLTAARDVGVPVIMIERPPPAAVDTVPDVDAAHVWATRPPAGP